ncbi:aspartate aminotransferase family protein [Caldicellulosiruptoraceae bacterium PP1]
MNLESIINLDEQYYMNVFGKRIPIVFEKGKGCYLYDSNNKKYLDFISGIAVNSLGHCHKRLTEAIIDQANKLIHTSSLYYIKNQALLAQKLCNKSIFDKAFFCNSGAEAVEGAIKLIRKYFYSKGQNRYEIITLKNAFHGRTLATVTATGKDKYKKPYEPLPRGFKNIEKDIEIIKNSINENTAAIMIELVQGEGGVNVLDKSFVKDIENICRENNILFVIDEVQTGIGRCGSLFAYELYDISPDIITLAKGLGGGIPIGAVLCKEDVAAFEPGDHGSTFGGNPFATRIALEVLNVIEEEDLLTNVNNIGKLFLEGLKDIKNKITSIVDVRGLGLLIGVEFKSNVKELNLLLAQNGLLASMSGEGNVIRFAPPLIVNEEAINEALNIFENVVRHYENVGGFNK